MDWGAAGGSGLKQIKTKLITANEMLELPADLSPSTSSFIQTLMCTSAFVSLSLPITPHIQELSLCSGSDVWYFFEDAQSENNNKQYCSKLTDSFALLCLFYNQFCLSNINTNTALCCLEILYVFLSILHRPGVELVLLQTGLRSGVSQEAKYYRRWYSK